MLTEIITTLTTAITSFGSSAVTAIVDNFDALAVTAEGDLTNVAVWGLSFMGVSLVIGLGRLVVGMVRSKG